MSITPRAQRLPPPRSKQADAALLLLRKPTTSNSIFLKRGPGHSSLSPVRREVLARPPACSFGGGSESQSKAKAAGGAGGSESPFKPRGGGPGAGAAVVTGRGGVGLLAPIRNREMGLLQFSRSNTNKYDGRGIILPESETNIEVDKLLAQWADKITKAEKEFEEEELVFERARARLCTSNNRGTLRALSPSPAARLVEKAKRIVSYSEILVPISARYPISNNNQHNNHPINETRTDSSEKTRHEIGRGL